MIIQHEGSCGNSPKNRFIEEFAVRLVQDCIREDEVSADCMVEIAETGEVTGIRDFCMGGLAARELRSVRIFSAISHGRKGAVDLVAEAADGSLIHLGIFLQFRNLKATEISGLKIFCC